MLMLRNPALRLRFAIRAFVILSDFGFLASSFFSSHPLPTMNRTGKIARLPHNLRNSINHRLDRNDPGRKIITWLNSLPAVKKILRDFLADTCESLHDATELEQLSPFMADHAARLLSARILNAVRKWNGDLDDPTLANLKHLSSLLRAIATLRRGDHSAARLKIQQSNHDRANAPADDDTESPGERTLLEGLRRLTYGVPRDTDADDKPPPVRSPLPPVQPPSAPAKSDLIAPNPTTSSAPNPTPSEPAPTHTHTLTPTPSEPVPLSEPASPSPSEPPHSTILNSPLSTPTDSTIHDSAIHDSPSSAPPPPCPPKNSTACATATPTPCPNGAKPSSIHLPPGSASSASPLHRPA
ncbi:MAG TPA: hypothetical protein VG796_13905 [Verrucomicrobiales bacterium]|nr:hypothetical protein [Verrucomicrobiales bacterium]